MTPSEAHDSAWKRDPGHDELQLAILRRVRESRQTVDFPFGTYDWEKAPSKAAFKNVQSERLFSMDGRVLFFADICQECEAKTEEKTFRGYVILEVKPKIYSVGAVMRQIEVIKLGMSRWVKHTSDNPKNGNYLKLKLSYHVFPVVLISDPKAQMLADTMGSSILGWNGDDECLQKISPCT